MAEKFLEHEFMEAEKRVGLHESLDPEQARALYAAYVRRGIELEQTQKECDRLTKGTWSMEIARRSKESMELREKLRIATEALELVAAPKRADGTYNRCREACEELAREALAKLKGKYISPEDADFLREMNRQRVPDTTPRLMDGPAQPECSCPALGCAAHPDNDKECHCIDCCRHRVKKAQTEGERKV